MPCEKLLEFLDEQGVSYELLKQVADSLAADFRRELHRRGLFAATMLVAGTVVAPGALDLEHELNRFYWKVEAGAEYAITQPVFDADQLVRCIRELENRDIRIPIVAGIDPPEEIFGLRLLQGAGAFGEDHHGGVPGQGARVVPAVLAAALVDEDTDDIIDWMPLKTPVQLGEGDQVTLSPGWMVLSGEASLPGYGFGTASTLWPVTLTSIRCGSFSTGSIASPAAG